MIFFFDNNLSPYLAAGMKAFGEEVVHLQDCFSGDVQDTEWLKFIGENNYFLLTRDDNIRHNPLELESLRKYNVGAFFIGGKNRKRCELIQQIVRNWPRIKEYSNSKRKPFAYRIPPSGTKFVKYSI